LPERTNVIKTGTGECFGVRFHGEIRIECSTENFDFPDNLMSVPAALNEWRSDKDLSLCGVPNNTTADLVGLSAMPFSQNHK